MTIPSGLSYHAWTSGLVDPRALESALEGYGVGSAIDATTDDQMGTLDAQTLREAGYVAGASAGEWLRSRPQGGTYRVTSVGSGGWVAWIDAPGAPPSGGQAAPFPGKQANPEDTRVSPAKSTMGGAGLGWGLAMLAAGLGLLLARKG